MAVDTNVLVSAVIADGPPRRVLELLQQGRAELVLATPVIVELRRILKVKIGVDDASIDVMIALLEELAAEIAAVPETVEPVSGDPQDDIILAAAAAAAADVLVSGDRRHVLPLGRYRAMRIMRTQDFLAEVAG